MTTRSYLFRLGKAKKVADNELIALKDGLYRKLNAGLLRKISVKTNRSLRSSMKRVSRLEV